MQTVILAAGEGSRMRPLTEERPRPMLPVAGRPLVEHVLDGAVSAGASMLVVVVGYEADAVRCALGDEHRGVPIVYAVKERPRETADAVRAARPHLEVEPFAVLAADNLYDEPSLDTLFNHVPSAGTAEVADPRNYGVFEIEPGRVTGIVENPEAPPPSSLVNVCACTFVPETLEWIDVDVSERGELELTDVLARAIETTDVRPVPFQRWLDVGRPWELLEANERKLAEIERNVCGDVSEGAEVLGDVVVESEAVIRAGAVVEGPVFIGTGAEIGPNAYLKGATALGPGATVGHAVEVKNSLLMRGAYASHLSYVGDSILGRSVNLGAGTVIGNLRHDDSPVALSVRRERVSTGRRKFGVVLGDGVKTGVGTCLNAGVTLSTETWTDPGEIVTRDR